MSPNLPVQIWCKRLLIFLLQEFCIQEMSKRLFKVKHWTAWVCRFPASRICSWHWQFWYRLENECHKTMFLSRKIKDGLRFNLFGAHLVWKIQQFGFTLHLHLLWSSGLPFQSVESNKLPKAQDSWSYKEQKASVSPPCYCS